MVFLLLLKYILLWARAHCSKILLLRAFLAKILHTILLILVLARYSDRGLKFLHSLVKFPVSDGETHRKLMCEILFEEILNVLAVADFLRVEILQRQTDLLGVLL